MLGAIIGDIVGSRFEFDNIKSKTFDFFTEECFATDDSIMTIAIAAAIMYSKPDYSNLSEIAVRCMRLIGQRYPNCGYGESFYRWMYSDNPKPYNSYGNGAAMRVSPVGFVARDPEEVKILSRKVTEVTHNHPEGIKGAEAAAMAIFYANVGLTKERIKNYINENYYSMDFTLDEIREEYQFNETCQNTVPQALEAFFEANNFEDAIRNAISIGGDSDTLAAICGGVAQAYYGIPDEIANKALTYLDEELIEIYDKFNNRYMK